MELVEGLFACKSLGVKAIKGLSRKVEVYQVVRALPGTEADRVPPAPRRDAHGGARGRPSSGSWLAGKMPETSRVARRSRSLAMPASARRASMLELSSRPEFVDATLLQGQCHEIFASTPLYPIRVFLWGRAGLTADDEESVRYDKISGYLDELGRNTAENRDLVASLLGMAAPDSGKAAAATPQLLKREAISSSSSRSSSRLRARDR